MTVWEFAAIVAVVVIVARGIRVTLRAIRDHAEVDKMLEAELTEARKDTARLDYLLYWLARHPIMYDGYTLGHRWGGDNHERRQGLDAARKREAPQ